MSPILTSPLTPTLDQEAARRVLLALTRGDSVRADDAALAVFPHLPPDRRLYLSVTATGFLSLWETRAVRDKWAGAEESLFTLELTPQQWDDLLVMARAALYTALAEAKASAPQEVA